MKEQIINSSAMLVALWVCHLIGDWIFQNDWIAMRKTKYWKVRALHVCLYCIPFGALLALLYSEPLAWVCAMGWIWATHFWIDSYKPLMWFRQLTGDDSAGSPEKFRETFNTPRGFFVYVTYDQIFHLVTLLPIAWSLGGV